MIPIDVKIESLLHADFFEFYRNANTELLASHLLKYHHAGYQYKMIEVLKGDVNDMINTAELAGIERILDNPNPRTTRPAAIPPAFHPVFYYCVFIKGKEIFILFDTNYKQYHWELRRLFKSFRTRRDNND